MDLSDVYLRKISFRKAGVLIERLPSESCTMTAIRNDSPESSRTDTDPDAPSKAPWSPDQMLAAQIIDELRFLRYSVDTFAAGSNADKIKVPENVVRPGVKAAEEPKRRNALTPEQRRALDPRLRAGTGHTF